MRVSRYSTRRHADLSSLYGEQESAKVCLVEDSVKLRETVAIEQENQCRGDSEIYSTVEPLKFILHTYILGIIPPTLIVTKKRETSCQ